MDVVTKIGIGSLVETNTMSTQDLHSKQENEYPEGWDREKVQEIIDYYDNQTDEEAIAEAEQHQT